MPLSSQPAMALAAQDMYMHEVKHISGLTSDEEQRLLAAIGEGAQDAPTARARMIEGYQPMVIGIAKRHVWGCRFLTLLDLIQEGNVALLRALDSYNPAKCKATFRVWAAWWIRCALRTAFWRHERGIRLSRETARLLRRMWNMSAQLLASLGYQPSAEELAAVLEVTTDQVHELLALDVQQVTSLDQMANDDGEFGLPQFAMTPQHEVDALDQCSAIRQLMATLPARARRVVELRYGFIDGQERSQQEVARVLGVARSTVEKLDRQTRIRLRIALMSASGVPETGVA